MKSRPKIPTTLFQCPPLNSLTKDEAITALVTIGDDPGGLRETFGKSADVKSLLKFIRQLKEGTIMLVSFSHGAMSDTTCIRWLWHPRYHCGILLSENDNGSDWTSFVPIREKTSNHLSSKLAQLLKKQGFLPGNIEGEEVELPLDGLEPKDLVAALAKGVFASDPDVPDPTRAAEDWVKRHSGQP